MNLQGSIVMKSWTSDATVTVQDCRHYKINLLKRPKRYGNKKDKSGFTPEQIEAYTTIGGTPFLDSQYTVFGEVEEGLDVVERIQDCETDQNDRPNEDVKIESVEIL